MKLFQKTIFDAVQPPKPEEPARKRFKDEKNAPKEEKTVTVKEEKSEESVPIKIEAESEDEIDPEHFLFSKDDD